MYTSYLFKFPAFNFFWVHTQKWHCLQNIFVPLKGIHHLQLGIQHLHQNQKRKTELGWKTKAYNVAEAESHTECVCLSVGGHKSACEGLPLPCTRGCSPKPSLPHSTGVRGGGGGGESFEFNTRSAPS